ncbi:HAD family hydrolase [Sorangium sp. So ce1128]
MIRTIGFDADDTLWHNENLFSVAQEKFRSVLSHYHSSEWIDRKLLETERRNLEHFGYGAKGFALSMLETAIELSEERITGSDVRIIIQAVKEILTEPVQPIEGVEETLLLLSREFQLFLITKGDLFEQETKIARSGLAEYFTSIEIVTEKSPATYRRILEKRGIFPAEFLMVGNSVRSDALPVLDIGGSAVHIPYTLTWEHERVEPPSQVAGFTVLDDIRRLPAHVAELSGRSRP